MKNTFRARSTILCLILLGLLRWGVFGCSGKNSATVGGLVGSGGEGGSTTTVPGANIPEYKPEDYKYLVTYKENDPAGPNSFDLIKQDLLDGKISRSQYFFQKVAYVIGANTLDPKYVQNADKRTNDSITCGNPVFDEMMNYLKSPDPDPEAVKFIRGFFLMDKNFENAPAKETASPEKNLNTKADGDNTCTGLPTPQAKNKIQQLKNAYPPPSARDLLHLNNLEKIARLTACITTDAGNGDIVEIYYIPGDQSELDAKELKTYLNSNRSLTKIFSNIYTTPSPVMPILPLYDLSRTDGSSLEDFFDRSVPSPYKIYMVNDEIGLPHPGYNVTGYTPSDSIKIRSAVMLSSTSIREVTPEVLTRQDSGDVIERRRVLHSVANHELIHAVKTAFWNLFSLANDMFNESVVKAMENEIDRNANYEFEANTWFLNEAVGTGIYKLTSETYYNRANLFFRYVSWKEKEKNRLPFAQYINSHSVSDSKSIIYNEYLKTGGIDFALMNLNFNNPGDTPDLNLPAYKRDDPQYPAGFSVPKVSGGPVIKLDQLKKEIKTSQVVNSGTAKYELLNVIGKRENHKSIIIDHSKFTSQGDTQLGVVLIHVDTDIKNNDNIFDRYVLGSLQDKKTIESLKYYKFNQGDPQGKICLDQDTDENTRPNLIMLIFVNNSKDALKSGKVEVKVKTTCENVDATVSFTGTETSNQNFGDGHSCDATYTRSLNITGKFEEKIPEDALSENNTALGSPWGILAVYDLVKDGKVGQLVDDTSVTTVETHPEQNYYHQTTASTYVDLAPNTPIDPDDWKWRMVLYNDGTLAVVNVPSLMFGNEVITIDGVQRSPIPNGGIFFAFPTVFFGRWGEGSKNVTLNGNVDFPFMHTGANSCVPRGQHPLIPTGGQFNVSLNIEMPSGLYYCTDDNYCIPPDKPSPSPPKYTSLPEFCKIYSDSFDVARCNGSDGWWSGIAEGWPPSECTVSSDCGAGKTCQKGSCVTTAEDGDGNGDGNGDGDGDGNGDGNGDGGGECINKEDGTSCDDDGNKCNGIKTCQNWVCTETTAPVVCAASDACHNAGTCNAATGQCSDPAKAEGTSCGTDKICQNGQCVINDTAGPGITQFSINNGDVATNNLALRISLNAQDEKGAVAGWYITEFPTGDPGYIPANAWSSDSIIDGRINWTDHIYTLQNVQNADGPKNITVYIKDNAGNITHSATKTITLDRSNPIVGLDMSPTSYANVFGLLINLSTTDIVAYQCSSDITSDNWINASAGMISNRQWTFPAVSGTYTLTCRARDAAGNVGSASASKTITFIQPSITSLTVNGGNPYTTNTSVQISIVFKEGSVIGTIKSYCFYEQGSAPICNAATTFGGGSWQIGSYLTLSSVNGQKTIIAELRDSSGKKLTDAMTTVTLQR